ncbi:MAG: gamma-glutamylcyclotransferase [Synergistaceae bacterium]|nr:gamma-glutamylcyclotransferase [Synergistaceae bacterium]MBR0204213.1 gamma-glutamylcyclotransferase [Synergistaceae bacterium]
MSKYYLAYGSNLSISNMGFRCPNAEMVGTGMLEGWQLVFNSYATIHENKEFNTPVVIWEISEQDEKSLDIYEGFPTVYYKRDFNLPVKDLYGQDLGNLTAMAYIMTSEAECEHSKIPIPSDLYYSIIDMGYQAFEFDRSILKIARKEASTRWCEILNQLDKKLRYN